MYILLNEQNLNLRPTIRSTFVTPLIDKDLMQKNVIYFYVRNPFLDSTGIPIDIETLRNLNDLTDRQAMIDILQNYYNVQNMNFELLSDIKSVVSELNKLYSYKITTHSSAESIIDFSNEPAFKNLITETSTVLTTSKQTFTSVYDTNEIGQITLRNTLLNKPVDVTVKSNSMSILQVSSPPTIVKKGMYIINDSKYFPIVDVTSTSIVVQNPLSIDVIFKNQAYTIRQTNGPPVYGLTKWLYDQSVNDNEIVIVFNNKILSFSMDSFEPGIFTSRVAAKKSSISYESPPYQNYRRQQLKNHFYKYYIL
jgi:hypothetical protein